MKKCSKCLRELPLEDFHVDKGHMDGRASRCKQCRAEWVASRKSQTSLYNAQYYGQYRDRRLIQIHEYQQKHPETKINYRHRYRARKRHADGRHTFADLMHIFERQQGECFYCSSQMSSWRQGHFDHVIPLTRGGTDNADNIVFACRACNWSKHDRMLEEWLQPKEQGRRIPDRIVSIVSNQDA